MQGYLSSLISAVANWNVGSDNYMEAMFLQPFIDMNGIMAVDKDTEKRFDLKEVSAVRNIWEKIKAKGKTGHT